jgi:hypothetical protein
VPFRARRAAIGGIGADRLALLLAGMLALSTLARSQLIRPASLRQSSSTWWSQSQTPAACQLRRRRQKVTRSHNPSRWAGTPKGCRSCARRESR